MDNLNLSTEFLTVQQAAARLQISTGTLRTYLKNGTVKGYKKFGRWYVFPSDLVAFLKSEEKVPI